MNYAFFNAIVFDTKIVVEKYVKCINLKYGGLFLILFSRQKNLSIAFGMQNTHSREKQNQGTYHFAALAS